MAKTVYKIPFGQGFKILQKGTLIERASLAKRYPLIAGAKPEEILLAIENLSMRQVETQLRNFVAAGHHVGTDHAPSLTQFATVVEDSQSEADLDTDPIDEEDDAPSSTKVSVETEDEVTPAPVATVECRYEDCSEVFESERGRNIHETRIHGTQYGTEPVVVDEPTQAEMEEPAEPEAEEAPAPVSVINTAITDREAEQVVAAGAAEVDETEEPGDDLDIFATHDEPDEEADELDKLLNPGGDDEPEPVAEPAAETASSDDDDEDDFLKSLGIVDV